MTFESESEMANGVSGAASAGMSPAPASSDCAALNVARSDAASTSGAAACADAAAAAARVRHCLHPFGLCRHLEHPKT